MDEITDISIVELNCYGVLDKKGRLLELVECWLLLVALQETKLLILVSYMVY